MTTTKRATKVQRRILKRMLCDNLLLGWAGTMSTPSLRRLVSNSEGRLVFDWPSAPDGFDGLAYEYNEVRWNSYCALTESPFIERIPADLHDRLFHEIGENETALVRYDGFGSRPTLWRLTPAGRREVF